MSALVALLMSAVPAAAQAEPVTDRQRVIVRLNSPGAVDVVAAEEERGGARVLHRYRRVLDGFAAEVPTGRLEALRGHPLVESVTADEHVTTTEVQVAPPWGLDRTDQRLTAGDGSYAYDTTGAGVSVYVLDTGIRVTHAEFGGRASSAIDYVDGTGTDCHGHGTHVAGTIGGATYGVAKQVSLKSVRVLDCSGRGLLSTVIAGMDWVVAHRTGPSIINMSLGGGASSDVDEAVARATAAGVVVAVAAGNDGQDACLYSPARAPGAITVGAADTGDWRAGFSNHGPCIDLFAPGVNVVSATTWDDTSWSSMSGTSMAAPHVAGVLARNLQRAPTASPEQMATMLAQSATPHVIRDALSANDNALYVAPPSATTAPGAPNGFTVSQSDADRTATIGWTPPSTDGGSPVTGYRVARSGHGAEAPWSTTVAATARSHTFLYLTAGGTYTLSVEAINAVGTGAAAASTVTIGGPPGAPTSFSASTDVPNRSATITWMPPTYIGGSAITGYRVSRSGYGGEAPWSTVVAATARTHTFLTLTTGGTYTLSVEAINALGTGPAASGTVTMSNPK